MKESILEKIWHHLFGYKYYAVISNRRGTLNVGIHENILLDYEDAKKLLVGNSTFEKLEIVSFRSREKYYTDWDDTLQRYVNKVV